MRFASRPRFVWWTLSSIVTFACAWTTPQRNLCRQHETTTTTTRFVASFGRLSRPPSSAPQQQGSSSHVNHLRATPKTSYSSRVAPLAVHRLTSEPCMRPWFRRELGHTTRRHAFDGEGRLRPRLAQFDADPLVLGVMEADDVPRVARLIAECFSPSIILSPELRRDDTWETAALSGVARFASAYDLAEYGIGLRARCGDRLSRPRDLDRADDPGSLVLTVARNGSAEAVAAVEIRLRDADGTAPAALPLLDRLSAARRRLAADLAERQQQPTEDVPAASDSFGGPLALSRAALSRSVLQRAAASARDEDDNSHRAAAVPPPPRPYISNLCVTPRCTTDVLPRRRRGIGAVLLSAAEFIAGPDVWGYDSVFLHVHKNNQAAFDLYKRAGYIQIPRTGSHFVDDDADRKLAYYYKPLQETAPDPETVARRLRHVRTPGGVRVH